jgi:hypothetical protein
MLELKKYVVSLMEANENVGREIFLTNQDEIGYEWLRLIKKLSKLENKRSES